jgi:hypothetical protein
MPHPQLRDILDRDDALARRRPGQQRREQGGLARPRCAGDEQVHPVAHERQHVGERDGVEEPAALEVGERRRPRRR